MSFMDLIDTLVANPAVYIGVCAVYGLLIGSFLNVVIHRLPVMMENELRAECSMLAATGDMPASPEAPKRYNLIVPRSACPGCIFCRKSYLHFRQSSQPSPAPSLEPKWAAGSRPGIPFR